MTREVRPAAQRHERDGSYPSKLIADAKAMGLFGLAVPTAFSGMGLPLPVFAEAMESIARAWTSFANHLTSHTTVSYTIARHGTDAQKAAFLPRMAKGELHAAILLTEEHAGSDLQAIRTTAVRQGDDYLITGRKVYISNGERASLLLVLAQTDRAARPPKRGLSLFLVAPETCQGVVRGTLFDKMAFPCVDTSEVILDSVRVPASMLLGEVQGSGLRQLLDGLEIGRLAIAAGAVGLAAAALDEAVAFAKDRQAFGTAIKNHQAIRIRLAEMATHIEGARALTMRAAVMLQSGPPRSLTAMAKLMASEVAFKVTTDALRVHGGAGYIRGVMVERLFREAPLYLVGEGTNDILKLAIARDLVRD